MALTLLIAAACSGENGTNPPMNGTTSATLTPDRDNTLYEDSTGQLSNGAGQFIFAGVTNQPLIRRGALHFDVAGSQIPAGSTIDSVTLTLHMSRTIGGTTTVSLHRFTSAWGEGGSQAGGAEGMGAASMTDDVTWIHAFFDTVSWTTPGGDFAAAATASTLVQTTGFYRWGSTPAVVADVQTWLDNPSTNFGWMIVGDESSPVTAKRFDSRENDVVANRPSLEIFYTAP